MADKETPERGSENASASDAYLKAQIASNQTVSAEAAGMDIAGKKQQDPDAAPKKWVGKFNSPEEMEEGYKNLQSQWDKTKKIADKAQKYPTFLEVMEEDPAYREFIAAQTRAYFNGGGGKEPEPEKEPMEMSPQELQGLIRREAAKAAQAIIQEQSRQAGISTELQSVRERYELDDDALRASVDRIRNASFSEIYDWMMAKDQLASARQAGREEAFGKLRQMGSRAPAIGAAPGAAERQRDLGDIMGDEILKAMEGQRGL